jgi:hypothetical protein
MMSAGMAKKVLGAAVSALEMARGVARHVAWYVTHQVDGRARDSDRQGGR